MHGVFASQLPESDSDLDRRFFASDPLTKALDATPVPGNAYPRVALAEVDQAPD